MCQSQYENVTISQGRAELQHFCLTTQRDIEEHHWQETQALAGERWQAEQSAARIQRIRSEVVEIGYSV